MMKISINKTTSTMIANGCRPSVLSIGLIIFMFLINGQGFAFIQPICSPSEKAQAGPWPGNTSCASPTTPICGFVPPSPANYNEIKTNCIDLLQGDTLHSCHQVELCATFVAPASKINYFQMATNSTCAGFAYESGGSETIYTDTCTVIDSRPISFSVGGPWTGLTPGQTYTYCLSYQQLRCEIIELFLWYSYPDTSLPGDSCVWPGDANSNGIVNVWDIFPIGYTYGSTGPSRTNASTSWMCHIMPDWPQYINGTLNYKHSDCNGDGTIDLGDVGAILQNYNLTHSKTIHKSGGSRDSCLYLELLEDSVAAGDTATVLIKLGDSIPITAYGLAFSILYDPNLVDSGTFVFDFSNSWLGNHGNDMISLHKDHFGTGQMDIGIVRTNQLDATGTGEVARCRVVMIDDIAGKNKVEKAMDLTIGNALVKQMGDSTLDIHTNGTSMVVYSDETYIPEPVLRPTVQVYPNPTDHQVNIRLTGSKARSVVITDIRGRKVSGVYRINRENITLHTDHLSNGIYILNIETDAGTLHEKINILK